MEETASSSSQNSATGDAMSIRYVIVINNVIVNAIKWDGVTAWSPPAGATVVPSDLGDIGWTWNNGAPVNPNPAPVQEAPVEDGATALTLRRAKELEASDDLADQIEGLKMRLKLLTGE